ncbi:2-oxo-4-hydroxy-4-carboxy-5-ureidoimidazoline decarboxylase [Mycobacterium sp. GA-1841]|uniref:2-oxo-4-hydroxy-4-carboxy-5-ureidoimidazoline decarboxylase n=1 Tax=Mycobacterium sp. GA-1841 TaxID=1834154 RepID=UPI0009F9C9CF|nr:2-oxo-4-hydroxy-4-carboxy-5-ureidoimidazoline decarboxylase [Mycobacterium sp. GA-1841]
MLMHQGVGLEAYNALPLRRAVHAVYECCYSVVLATDLAGGRPYADHDALLRRADALLFSLGEVSIDRLLQAYPHMAECPPGAVSMVRAELARINRARLERMLGPEGGFYNW